LTRIPPGPPALTPFARRLSVTHIGSVRNLNRSDFFSPQEKTTKHPEIIKSITRFFMIFNLSELTEETNVIQT
jgi:hypothetical protein